MTKITVDIGDREDGFCADSHSYYHDNKCPFLEGGGIGVYWCKLTGNSVHHSGDELPQRSKFCKSKESKP